MTTRNEQYPNIVFVLADQLRYDSLGCNGNRVVQTPNTDTLARDGIAFDQAFSVTPICSPYRAQILTGNYAHTNGVICNEYRLFDSQRTLPQLLKPFGYRSAFVGKWHLGYGPYYEQKRYGFDDLYAYNCDHRYHQVSYWHNDDGPHRFVEFAPRGETMIAIDYLRRHAAGGQPVCLFLSWGPPHTDGLKKERRYGDYPQEHNIYDPVTIELSPNVPYPLRDYAQAQLADYYGMITSLDESMGHLLKAIDAMGLRDETIVCFSSDHGDLLGSHGYLTPADYWLAQERRLAKASPYTESCKIPLIIRYPGRVPHHARSQCLFTSVDIVPTLLSLCGIAIPDAIQGKNLVKATLDPEVEGPASIYLQILGPGWPNRSGKENLWRCVRTRSHIYARWKFPSDRRLLIDLQRDPSEMHNLAGLPKHAEILAEMQTLLTSWIERTADPFDTGIRSSDNGMLNVGQAFTTRRWQSEAPSHYAKAIESNYNDFRTGEQETDWCLR